MTECYTIYKDRFDQIIKHGAGIVVSQKPMMIGEIVKITTPVKGKRYSKAVNVHVIFGMLCEHEHYDVCETIGKLFGLPTLSWDDLVERLNVDNDTILFFQVVSIIKGELK